MSIATDQWPRRHRINVDQFHRMVEVGLLPPDARVELIEGVIVDMAPIGSQHAGVVNLLMETLLLAAGRHATVTVQQPLRLDSRSQAQPDVMLLRRRSDFYRKCHATAADVLLLIEVSDTTLRFDRGKKTALYAKHGIQELWIVDLENRQLHCMREPAGELYLSVMSFSPPANLAVAALPQVQVELAALFE